MIALSWFLICVAAFIALAYHRSSLIVWTLSVAILLGFSYFLFDWHWVVVSFFTTFFVLFALLNIRPLRRQVITKPMFRFYRSIMPTMSRTEREAIGAGTVTWEGDLFRGDPNWDKLLKMPTAKLSEEEQAFLAGPVEELCAMIDDWDITHNLADLPKHVWQFLKDNGFFALIIPKEYGGKAFSAYAHSQILTKIAGRSITASSTVSVPNSLGPAELLLHYGTTEQKNYYLPRLARGEEIPCFALTSPEAGSDAGSMTDHGEVAWGEYQGEKILGIKLNFNKRYITLAPIATVIGLAFKLYDPNHLLGSKTDIGITCALLPRNTEGIQVGRRHFALNTPFMNGPVSGKDIFVPLGMIIGGKEKAGMGWKMLMECLAAGRAISLPSGAIGGAKVAVYATGAYARIRRQFNMAIGKFEGVQEPLARIGAFTYLIDAARTFATASIDAGEKPSVASAIVKYHSTELGRKVAVDAMDIHGGKGIMLGPKNYLGRSYESIPIAITVEGANILTRNLIIFGQGVIRCHPYVLTEMEAARVEDPKKALMQFDNALFKHMGFAISNVVRSFFMGITSSYGVRAPKGKFKRYFQHATRFSSALALVTDISMMVLGGNLKRKEFISARLGDILSYLYLLSAVIKHYQDQGAYLDDLPLVRYASLYCLFEIQERFDELIKNFPNPLIALLLRFLVFPLGQRFHKPLDKIHHKIAQLLIAPTESRERLAEGAFLTAVPGNRMADLQDALLKSIASENIEKDIRTASRDNLIGGYTRAEQAEAALEKKIITAEEYDLFIQAEIARQKVIAVDDFTSENLMHMIKTEKEVYYPYAESDGTHG